MEMKMLILYEATETFLFSQIHESLSFLLWLSNISSSS